MAGELIGNENNNPRYDQGLPLLIERSLRILNYMIPQSPRTKFRKQLEWIQSSTIANHQPSKRYLLFFTCLKLMKSLDSILRAELFKCFLYDSLKDYIHWRARRRKYHVTAAMQQYSSQEGVIRYRMRQLLENQLISG